MCESDARRWYLKYGGGCSHTGRTKSGRRSGLRQRLEGLQYLVSEQRNRPA